MNVKKAELIEAIQRYAPVLSLLPPSKPLRNKQASLTIDRLASVIGASQIYLNIL